KDPESDAAVNVRETRRTYDRARKLPSSLVEELSRTSVLAQQAWGEARKASDYPKFRPWLEKILDLKRQEVECVGYKSDPYDALRRAVFRRRVLRRTARDRPRPLQPGPPRRPLRHAARRVRLHRHPREPVPHVGKPRRPQPPVLEILPPQGPRRLPRRPRRRL